MRFPILLLIFGILAGAVSVAQEPSGLARGAGFQAVDVYIDSKGKPLAAYQVAFEAQGGGVKIVGIEGGEHPAFQNPPFYDPAAMQKDRAILAAFNTEAAERLPRGKTKVATIHLQMAGQSLPAFVVKLETAASSDGGKIQAEASFEEKK